MKLIKTDGVVEYEYIKTMRLREAAVSSTVTDDVRRIISDVTENGDAALIKYTAKFDGINLSTLEVSCEEIQDAYNTADEKLINVMEKAAENIRKYHEKQLKDGYSITLDGGSVIGQRIRSLTRVGIYVPAGTAPYPSSVLMNAIPASVAGVKEIIMVTPPQKDGNADKNILAAAKIAGVTRIFKVGGAQAVAALAYGTQTIPQVDKITGPGNVYVATAKREVFGVVNIDMIAGPSEILIIADKNANPGYIAADLLSQAEHDVKASAILLTTSKELAQRVCASVDEQLESLSRKDIAKKSIEQFGCMIICRNNEEMFNISNTIAPEHLEILTENPMNDLEQVINAGSVFLGEYSPEPLGDYFAGTNHVLPTSGSARFSSPLSVDDFIKKSSYINYTRKDLERVHDDIEYFANAEGLTAHENSIKVRFAKQ